MKRKIIKNMNYHNENLNKYATKDKEAIYLKEKSQLDFRTSFFRDIDKILYTLSYVRYMDKTQVFSFQESDHISKRMIHVQYVSKIARTIGRALGLNEDLIEAIALGHDLGHVPFGHVGEKILNEISLANGCGYFNHNIHSVRMLKEIESYGNGLNITLQTLDGIMCHNGEILTVIYKPNYHKSKEKFLNEYESSYKKAKANNICAMTLEGCVVRISDMIAYLGKDIEDATRLKIIKEEDVPEDIKKILGIKNKDIINSIILDIINNSIGKKYIKLSEDVFQGLKKLKKFNYENIYFKANTEEQIKNYQKMFQKMYQKFLFDLKQKNKTSIIFKSYLNNMSESYQNNNSQEQLVLDYIAGMTDDYFLTQYEKL